MCCTRRPCSFFYRRHRVASAVESLNTLTTRRNQCNDGIDLRRILIQFCPWQSKIMVQSYSSVLSTCPFFKVTWGHYLHPHLCSTSTIDREISDFILAVWVYCTSCDYPVAELCDFDDQLAAQACVSSICIERLDTDFHAKLGQGCSASTMVEVCSRITTMYLSARDILFFGKEFTPCTKRNQIIRNRANEILRSMVSTEGSGIEHFPSP